jgi:hypothetical protein
MTSKLKLPQYHCLREQQFFLELENVQIFEVHFQGWVGYALRLHSPSTTIPSSVFISPLIVLPLRENCKVAAPHPKFEFVKSPQKKANFNHSPSSSVDCGLMFARDK